MQVTAFFHAYIACRSISTLHDLGRDLASEEGVAGFEDLGLGPLAVFPLAQRYFAPSKVGATFTVPFLVFYRGVKDKYCTG